MQDAKPILSKSQVIVRISAIILVTEMLVMLILNGLGPAVSLHQVLLLDGVLLLLFSTLPIYLFVIKPFADAHERAHEQVSYLAYHDSLTGLPNRRLFFEHLQRAVAATSRHQVFGALLLIDLDGFKAVNDNLGHEMGDILLCEVAQRLSSHKRHEDVAGRLGGDEFVVLAQQLDSNKELAGQKANAIAENLRRALCKPIALEKQSLSMGLSIGVRLLEPGRISVAEALREADAAMYLVKSRHQGGVHIYQPGTQPHSPHSPTHSAATAT